MALEGFAALRWPQVRKRPIGSAPAELALSRLLPARQGRLVEWTETSDAPAHRRFQNHLDRGEEQRTRTTLRMTIFQARRKFAPGPAGKISRNCVKNGKKHLSTAGGLVPEPSEYLLDRSGWYYVENFIENLTQLFGAVDHALDRNLTVPRLDFKPAID